MSKILGAVHFLSLINFQLVLVFYLLVIATVAYAISILKTPTAEAGLISGIYVVGTLVGRLILGKYMTTIDPKLTLLIGALGFFIFSCFYLIPVDVSTLIGIRFGHGFMMGVVATVLGTVLAQTLPASRRGEGISYYSMSSTLGTAIGPFLAIWMMASYSFSTIFAFTCIIALSSFILCFFVKTPQLKMPAKSYAQSSMQTSKLAQFIEPKALPIALLILIVGICYSGVLSFINLYAKEINLIHAASFFFLMYAIAILISRPITGPLMDRKGENIIMYPAIILMALGIALLSFANNAWMMLASAALLGFGFGNIQSICQTIAVKSTVLERMGLATTTFFIALDGAMGFGPFLIGLFLDYISFQELYLYSAIITISCLLWYYLLHGRHVGHTQTI